MGQRLAPSVGAGDPGSRRERHVSGARGQVQGLSAGRRLKSGQQRTENDVKVQKDVKIEGTNSASPLESINVSENELKTNSKRTGENVPYMRLAASFARIVCSARGVRDTEVVTVEGQVNMAPRGPSREWP